MVICSKCGNDEFYYDHQRLPFIRSKHSITGDTGSRNFVLVACKKCKSVTGTVLTTP